MKLFFCPWAGIYDKKLVMSKLFQLWNYFFAHEPESTIRNLLWVSWASAVVVTLPYIQVETYARKNICLTHIKLYVNKYKAAIYSSQKEYDWSPKWFEFLVQAMFYAGDRSSSLSSDKRLSQQSFQASVASAPEVYRKNSVQEDPWRKTSLVHQHLETPEEMLNDFAKSWPLAPHPGALGNQRLPDIHGRMEPSKTEKRTQCSGNLAEDLAKFNQGRKFRMRHRNFANTEQSAHYDKVLKHHQVNAP